MGSAAWSSLGIFAACYALFASWPARRSLVAAAGALAMVAAGVLTPRTALLEKVSWNVVGLSLGTLVLAELFMHSRMPAVLAARLAAHCPSARWAMLAVSLLSGVLSIAAANVAVVLLVAPVALSLAEKLHIDPKKLIICVALSSNLQGTATLIGDPPSMIFAGYMHMGFMDFFWYRARPGIFFAVQVGLLASALVMFWFFRRHRERVAPLPAETLRSWMPTWLMLFLVAGLSFASLVDPDFRWFAGVFALGLGVVGLAWFRWCVPRPDRPPVHRLLISLDWDTNVFLVGVFVLVGGLSDAGWLEQLAAAMAGLVGTSAALAFLLLILVAVVVSGFVDNIPFVLAMLPVADRLAGQLGVSPLLLMYGMLLGTCLGGNITPIGASANVVAIGILNQRGHRVGFAEFLRLGLPFTLATTAAACLWVWLTFHF